MTLYEICCARDSKTARCVTRDGGAAVRVTWPPQIYYTALRNSTDRVPSRAVQLSVLRLPTPVAGKTVRWYLNIDWPAHRSVLLQHLRTVRPAPGTHRVVLLTSPECRMFAQPQRLQHAMGNFDWEAHAVAVKRLRYIRRLQQAFRSWRRIAPIDGLGIHEQPPCASQDLQKKYVESDDFPWAIGRKSSRRAIHGCMCGRTAANGLLVYKGWRFEVDTEEAAAALDNHRCDGTHEHATTTVRLKNAAHLKRNRTLRTSELETYPPYLGSLLTSAASARVLHHSLS